MFSDLINSVNAESKHYEQKYIIAYPGKAYDPSLRDSKTAADKGHIDAILGLLDGIEQDLYNRKILVQQAQTEIANLKRVGLHDNSQPIQDEQRKIDGLTLEIQNREEQAKAQYQILERLGVMVQLQQGQQLSDQVLQWLGQHANCPSLATFEYKFIATAEDRTKQQYKIVKSDGSQEYANLGRLLSYLSSRKFMDQALKFPILILCANTMMVD